jgi:aryl-alcohol dehydrogenase-like predicted oxidoreductase
VRYRALGRSGLRISVLGLGCANLAGRVAAAEFERLVRSAVDLGVSLFDTADVYGGGASEEDLGSALRGVRDQVVVATKVRWAMGPGANDRGASCVHIRSAVEASLRRLGTDRIDLYQIHAPDPVTPIEESLAALDDLVTSGKVLYIGTSNFAGWQIMDAHWQAEHDRRTRFISTQFPYSLLDRRADIEILPATRHCGLGAIACLVLPGVSWPVRSARTPTRPRSRRASAPS